MPQGQLSKPKDAALNFMSVATCRIALDPGHGDDGSRGMPLRLGLAADCRLGWRRVR